MDWVILTVVVLVTVFAFVQFVWRCILGVAFRVERLGFMEVEPQFRRGGLSTKERVCIANEVRARTLDRISHVIVDDSAVREGAAYAYTGAKHGVKYTLQFDGIDQWRIVSEKPWATRPRTDALASPPLALSPRPSEKDG
jgi:hypothetical protein